MPFGVVHQMTFSLKSLDLVNLTRNVSSHHVHISRDLAQYLQKFFTKTVSLCGNNILKLKICALSLRIIFFYCVEYF